MLNDKLLNKLQQYKNIFITATDTNVGKTITSAWLCEILQADYFKPIQSGINDKPPFTDSDYIASLNLPNTIVHPEVYCFKHGLSPHLAAKLENMSIDFDSIKLPKTDNQLIVEGAGGVFVPLNDKYFIIDLIIKFNFPCIVVSRTSLGTINHTCLTINALRQRNINIIGVVLIGEENEENKKALETYCNVDILAIISNTMETIVAKIL